MHKTDLVKVIASQTGLSQKDVANVVDATLKNITSSLKKGNPVTLIGFGTFKTVRTEARKGRNPQTGKEIQIAASNRVKFSAGKALKDSVN